MSDTPRGRFVPSPARGDRGTPVDLSGRPDQTPEQAERTLAQCAKELGMTKATYLRTRRETIEDSAKRGGWSPAETAATLADVELMAKEVWP